VIAARDTGEPLAVGVNLVVSAGSSVLHAEVVAILRAQRRGGFHRVGGRAGVPATLFTSAEPCAMCMGAIPWSGLSRVVCGATDADVRGIGFDEGDKPAGWAAAYERRGILVRAGVLRAEAAGVLRGYREAGGAVY
jgi:tRNA(Arg) A34 adenosine deaminase TadA